MTTASSGNAEISTIDRDWAPLPYRIIAFHHAKRADTRLILLARQLGFNEVQFQTEDGTVRRVEEFAVLDKQKGLVRFCHQQGMKVSLWVHEFEELPADIGPLGLHNDKLWALIHARYRRILTELVPQVDTLVLTVVESSQTVTEPGLLSKLVGVIREECQKAKKGLVVRTFVWRPEEFTGVMEAVKNLPSDVKIMSKVVPQDWNMRGQNDAAVGAVGNHQQIIEFDLAGEYFYGNKVANCFPQTILRQVEYGRRHGISGVCARVDRGNENILNQPQEVNLWALASATGGLQSGRSSLLPPRSSDVWLPWATRQFGPRAARAAVMALRTSGSVIAEGLCIHSFTFGDTRSYPPFKSGAFDQNWQPHHWAYLSGESYVVRELYKKLKVGDPLILKSKEQTSPVAIDQAKRALVYLEGQKERFRPEDYTWLKAKLTANLQFVENMTTMELAYLRMRRLEQPIERAERSQLLDALAKDADRLEQLKGQLLSPIIVTRQGHPETVVRSPVDPTKWLKQLAEYLTAEGKGD